ncbi:uncharacterized protein LY89DRAFT_366556 [Mollisia scopiformis]|uniref:Uncharacterized protein n=1 Tax=Mollisia scopiformis TaxID=149040 RepID=A0A132B507_MOLSC|nr:uncharacterized protein LY89DRAFT_366556 [Mollisia scopiformis]KUJ07421.1 hypothetical protein LY89DRAFT_366556 [Mollisia scopiformis]
MERYIGVLKGMVSLMSNMGMDLANRVITKERLDHLPRVETIFAPQQVDLTQGAEYPKFSQIMVHNRCEDHGQIMVKSWSDLGQLSMIFRLMLPQGVLDGFERIRVSKSSGRDACRSSGETYSSFGSAIQRNLIRPLSLGTRE